MSSSSKHCSFWSMMRKICVFTVSHVFHRFNSCLLPYFCLIMFKKAIINHQFSSFSLKNSCWQSLMRHQSPLEVSDVHPLLCVIYHPTTTETHSSAPQQTAEMMQDKWLWVWLKKEYDWPKRQPVKLRGETFVTCKNRFYSVCRNQIKPGRPLSVTLCGYPKTFQASEWQASAEAACPAWWGHSSHTGSMSDVGHLASGQDSKQRKGPSTGVHWMNLSMSRALRHPARSDPPTSILKINTSVTIHLQSLDTNLTCHPSSFCWGIILLPLSNEFRTSEQATDGTSAQNVTKHSGLQSFFFFWWLLFV